MTTELLPETLAPLLQHTRFAEARHIHHFHSIASTNTAALRAAAEGAPEGSIFIAEEQTAGRGRGDHNWHSAASQGIYLSVILRPPLPPGDVLILSLAAGLAVHAAVKTVTGLIADLKWPNDLLLGQSGDPAHPQKKFCGILAEMSAEIMRVRHLVLGIGINVNQTEFPALIAARATSLRHATGNPVSRAALTAAFLHALDREYSALLTPGSAARSELIRRFEAHSSMVHGRTIQVDSIAPADSSPAPPLLIGVTAGLNQQGFLLLQTSTGIQPILAGTIHLVD